MFGETGSGERKGSEKITETGNKTKGVKADFFFFFLELTQRGAAIE